MREVELHKESSNPLVSMIRKVAPTSHGVPMIYQHKGIAMLNKKPRAFEVPVMSEPDNCKPTVLGTCEQPSPASETNCAGALNFMFLPTQAVNSGILFVQLHFSTTEITSKQSDLPLFVSAYTTAWPNC